MILVQAALENDVESICDLDAIVIGSDRRRDWLFKAVKAEHCLKASIDHSLVGFAIVDRLFFGEAFLSLIIVHPEHRRKGVGTALVRSVESTTQTRKLFTSTNRSNVTAQKFFESLQFAKSGCIENLDEGDPEIVYFKRLRHETNH